MKKEQIFSLIINGLIVALSIIAFILLLNSDTRPIFAFFTNLSNVAMALSALVSIVFTMLGKEYWWFNTLYHAITVCVSLTFLVVATFLAPLTAIDHGDYFELYRGNMFFYHFINPLLAIINYIFFTNEKRNYKESLFSLVPVLIYMIVYGVCVLTNTWSDFYNFTFGGKYYLIPIFVPLLLGVTYLLSLGERLLHNKMIELRK